MGSVMTEKPRKEYFSMNSRALCTVLFMLATTGGGYVQAAEPPFGMLLNDHKVRTPPRIPVPALHQEIKDPVFGTTIKRITAPTQMSGKSRIRHFYSKSNPFNANETRAIMYASDGDIILYDAITWRPIKSLDIDDSEPEIQWHPTDPNIFYFMYRDNSLGEAMYRYDVRNDSQKLVHSFREYENARGLNEGNMDKSGRYYALVGFRNDKASEAFVYDVMTDKTSKRLPVTERMVEDWISVSPSGRYVVMMGGDRSRVYDINMKHLHDLPKGSFGHADICQLADGSEALVYDGADHELDRNRNINIADLATGKVRIGVRIGWRSTPHVSCRNLDLPGWALISTSGPDNKYPNHDLEIFWLKLDGSGEVRRVAHHRSSRERGGYFAETQAVTNRDGSKIIFASNWDGEEVNDYLIDFGRARHPTSSPPARQP
jgi:hypothetical protein